MRYFPSDSYAQTVHRVKTDNSVKWSSATVIVAIALVLSILTASILPYPYTIRTTATPVRNPNRISIRLEDDANRFLAKVHAPHGSVVRKGDLLFETVSVDPQNELALEREKESILEAKSKLSAEELEVFEREKALRLSVAKVSLQQAKAAEARSRKALVVAQRTVQRLQELLENNHRVQKELSDAKIEEAKSRLALREQALERSRAAKELELITENLAQEERTLRKALVDVTQAELEQQATTFEKEIALKKNLYYAPIDGRVGWNETPQIGKKYGLEDDILAVTPISSRILRAVIPFKSAHLVRKGMPGEFLSRPPDGGAATWIHCRVTSFAYFRENEDAAQADTGQSSQTSTASESSAASQTSTEDSLAVFLETEHGELLPVGYSGPLNLEVGERTALQAILEAAQRYQGPQ